MGIFLFREGPVQLKPQPKRRPQWQPHTLSHYSAVLRCEDLLGDEETPDETPAAPIASQRPPRLVAGLMVGLIVLPVMYFFWTRDNRSFLPVAGLVLLTSTLGVYAGFRITANRLGTWARELSRRTGRYFGHQPRVRFSDPSSVVSYLENVTRSLQTRLEGQFRNERDAFISTITSLVSALEARDPYTRNHSGNVAKLAVRIGKQMGISKRRLYEIHLGGLLHDVGKIGIRDEILLKPAGLTREEYEVMKSHPEMGAQILSGLPGFDEVRGIVLHHHEMYNGTGYPSGLAGKDIPLGARIVAVADTYLSLVEDRPYRPGRSLEKTRRELQRVAGKQHDPKVLDALFALMDDEASKGRTLFTKHPVEAAPDRRAA